MTTQILSETQAPEIPAEQPDMLALMQRPCGCCGSKETQEEGGVGLFWDDKQHLRLLNGAIRALDRMPNDPEWAALFPIARRLVNLMNVVIHPEGEPSGPFYEAVKEGLRDADYKPEYTGTYGGVMIYYMHFYDAKTGQSFYPGFENARTECEKYFNQSLFACPETANWEQRQQIGYRLGLALHYLTDVTQPMHAVNFTNYLDYRPFFSPANLLEKRHSAFEGYADSERFNLNPGKYTVAQLDPAHWGSYGGAGVVLHNVSACSRNLYDNTGIRRLVDSKWPWDGFGSEADPHIIRCLDHGIFHTAMFLLYFAQRAPRD
ncbi:MAG TPA: hypothetical protein VGJ81_06800 [Thermoanaerobaculia bacterium]|jgi:hypothetical protein